MQIAPNHYSIVPQFLSDKDFIVYMDSRDSSHFLVHECFILALTEKSGMSLWSRVDTQPTLLNAEASEPETQELTERAVPWFGLSFSIFSSSINCCWLSIFS